MLQMRIRWIAIILLLSLALAACGGDDDSGSALKAPPTADPAASTAAPGDPGQGEVMLPTGGALLITRGSDLYLYDFAASDGDAPVLIAQDVAENSVSFLQERNAVLYASPAERQYTAIYLYDLATGDTALLIDMGNLYISSWRQLGLSPDGEWLLINLSFMSGVVRLGDPDSWQEIESGGSRVEWLADGRVLVSQIEFEYGADGSPVQIVRGVQVFDPGDGTLSPVELDLDAINAAPDGSAFVDAIAAHGLAYPPRPAAPEGPVPVSVPPENGASVLCGTWRVVEYTPGDPSSTATGPTLYTAEDVYSLTLAADFDDGSLLVVESTTPTCGIMDTPTGALKLISPEGEAQTLADGLFVGPGVTYNPSPVAARRYVTISPDKRYVVWTGGGLDAGTISLHLLDLDTGAATVLYREDLMQGAGTGAAGDLLVDAIIWIAAE